MSTQAVVVDPEHPERFVIRDFDDPKPQPNEATIRVHAVSVNRGEVRYSMSAPAGRRPGWDFAGIVDRAAADGSGPKAGSRVVGLLSVGAWAHRVTCPTSQLAAIPEEVTFGQAATLPVAGLTALHSLYKGGFLVEKPVLVTGATGGTGDMTTQLAKLGGAKVVATVRTAARKPFVENSGADVVIVGENPTAAEAYGPYPLIVDSVGGPHFGKVLQMLARGGTCVVFGTTAGSEPQINAAKFYQTGAATLYGLMLFQEIVRTESASVGLEKLASLVATGKLRPTIEVEESWTKVADVCRRLTERSYVGKAVLHLD